MTQVFCILKMSKTLLEERRSMQIEQLIMPGSHLGVLYSVGQ